MVPPKTRGIYVLYNEIGTGESAVRKTVYIGMARGEKGGARGRLTAHKSTKTKKPKFAWTHFTVFSVWDNIPPKQVEELEGLIRRLFRLGSSIGLYNTQMAYKPLRTIRVSAREAAARKQDG